MYKSEDILVFVVLVTYSLMAQVKGSKHGVEQGEGTRKVVNNKHADLLIYHESLKRDGKVVPYPTIQSQEICYPPKKSQQAKLTITAFNVEDLGKGGVAYMKKNAGGVGKHKVCFHLKSQRGHGYHFNVDVWGYFH